MSGAALLQRAADALKRGTAAQDLKVVQLLQALDYEALLSSAPPPDAGNALKLLDFAGRLPALFQFDSPYAPGLAFFGGLVEREGERSSVTGRGMTLRSAFEGCVDEAVEFASQWERDDDRLSHVETEA